MSTIIRTILKRGLPLIAAPALLLGGCATNSSSQLSNSVPGGSPPFESEKGGAQLWSENCARCHNVRSPSSYSDGEWQVAMMHMRVRANLTADDHRRILEFLKSAN